MRSDREPLKSLRLGRQAFRETTSVRLAPGPRERLGLGWAGHSLQAHAFPPSALNGNRAEPLAAYSQPRVSAHGAPPRLGPTTPHNSRTATHRASVIRGSLQHLTDGTSRPPS